MSEQRAVIVICDSLRRDLINSDDAPFLTELSERAAYFAAHRSVFPSTTRASAATIATGCLPARHGLLGNTMALDEGDGLVCRSAGAPDFRDRMRRATGRTLRVPTLAERLRWHGETSISVANVSPGAAYFQDPDGHGWVYHAAGSYGPGCKPVNDPASQGLTKGVAGDRAMTERFCADILEQRAWRLNTGDRDHAVGIEQELDHHHRVVALLQRLTVEKACQLRQRLGVVVDSASEVLLMGGELVGDLLIELGHKRRSRSHDSHPT